MYQFHILKSSLRSFFLKNKKILSNKIYNGKPMILKFNKWAFPSKFFDGINFTVLFKSKILYSLENLSCGYINIDNIYQIIRYRRINYIKGAIFTFKFGFTYLNKKLYFKYKNIKIMNFYTISRYNNLKSGLKSFIIYLININFNQQIPILIYDDARGKKVLINDFYFVSLLNINAFLPKLPKIKLKDKDRIFFKK